MARRHGLYSYEMCGGSMRTFAWIIASPSNVTFVFGYNEEIRSSTPVNRTASKTCASSNPAAVIFRTNCSFVTYSIFDDAAAHPARAIAVTMGQNADAEKNGTSKGLARVLEPKWPRKHLVRYETAYCIRQ